MKKNWAESEKYSKWHETSRNAQKAEVKKIGWTKYCILFFVFFSLKKRRCSKLHELPKSCFRGVGGPQMDVQTDRDRQTDRQTNKQTDGRTDGRTHTVAWQHKAWLKTSRRQQHDFTWCWKHKRLQSSKEYLPYGASVTAMGWPSGSCQKVTNGSNTNLSVNVSLYSSTLARSYCGEKTRNRFLFVVSEVPNHISFEPSNVWWGDSLFDQKWNF